MGTTGTKLGCGLRVGLGPNSHRGECRQEPGALSAVQPPCWCLTPPTGYGVRTLVTGP